MLYSLIHHITCRIEARQALIYQLVSGLTGENGKYNDAKAVHFYPPFFDIFCSPKNNKTVSALTALNKIGATITKYYATEIDKFAVKTTQHNFPDTIQLGDAFQTRSHDWRLL